MEASRNACLINGRRAAKLTNGATTDFLPTFKLTKACGCSMVPAGEQQGIDITTRTARLLVIVGANLPPERVPGAKAPVSPPEN